MKISYNFVQGNFTKVKEIFKSIQDDGLRPSVQSFAACLECLGRLAPNSLNKQLISSYLDQLKNAVRFLTFQND